MFSTIQKMFRNKSLINNDKIEKKQRQIVVPPNITRKTRCRVLLSMLSFVNPCDSVVQIQPPKPYRRIHLSVKYLIRSDNSHLIFYRNILFKVQQCRHSNQNLYTDLFRRDIFTILLLGH